MLKAMHKYEYVNIKPLYTIKSLQLALYFLYLVHLFNCSLTRVANQPIKWQHLSIEMRTTQNLA